MRYRPNSSTEEPRCVCAKSVHIFAYYPRMILKSRIPVTGQRSLSLISYLRAVVRRYLLQRIPNIRLSIVRKLQRPTRPPATPAPRLSPATRTPCAPAALRTAPSPCSVHIGRGGDGIPCHGGWLCARGRSGGGWCGGGCAGCRGRLWLGWHRLKPQLRGLQGGRYLVVVVVGAGWGWLGLAGEVVVNRVGVRVAGAIVPRQRLVRMG